MPLKHWSLLLIVNDDVGCGPTFMPKVVESLQPKLVVDTSFTVNEPDEVYEWLGEVAVDVVASPKFHKKVDAPVAVFVNAKLFPLKHWPLLLTVKDDVGCGLTFIPKVVESLQP